MSGSEVRLTELVSCGGCAAKYSAALLAAACSAGFAPTLDAGPPRRARARRTTRPSTASTTSARSSSRSTSSRRSSTTRPTSAPSRRRTRSTTSSRWAARRCSRSRSPRSRRSCRTEMLAEIFAAADAKVRAAGGLLAGGHTIRDEEPKYGLAVVGTVAPRARSGRRPARAGRRALPDEAARDGAARPRGRSGAASATRQLERGGRGWMQTLNAEAAELLRAFEPNAVTDVTGFGLLGHAYELAERSGVRVELDAERCPRCPARSSSRAAGVRTGGDPRNRDYAGRRARGRRRLPRRRSRSAYDPQTAGGLLVSLPAGRGADAGGRGRRGRASSSSAGSAPSAPAAESSCARRVRGRGRAARPRRPPRALARPRSTRSCAARAASMPASIVVHRRGGRRARLAAGLGAGGGIECVAQRRRVDRRRGRPIAASAAAASRAAVSARTAARRRRRGRGRRGRRPCARCGSRGRRRARGRRRRRRR